jgi:hypothetical protein
MTTSLEEAPSCPEHVAGQLGRAIASIRRNLELSDPVIGAFGEVIQVEETGEWWAFPFGAGVAIGPFGNLDDTAEALGAHAKKQGNKDGNQG